MFGLGKKDGSPRQMVQGNWQCSECQGQISELPFEPTPGAPIYCKECWQKKRPARNANGPRQSVKGNWQCSECSKEITELPFEPAQDRPVYCKDCWAKKRDER